MRVLFIPSEMEEAEKPRSAESVLLGSLAILGGLSDKAIADLRELVSEVGTLEVVLPKAQKTNRSLKAMQLAKA